MEEDVCKGGTLCASFNDAICWCGYPWVKLVASYACAGHVHLQPQLQHQWRVFQPCGFLH
eukprot:11538214-Karenia_brevis.AAC.1